MNLRLTDPQVRLIWVLLSDTIDVTVDVGLRRRCLNLRKKIDGQRLAVTSRRMRRLGRAILDVPVTGDKP